MRAKLRCKVESFMRDSDLALLKVESFEGKVDTQMIPAQKVSLKAQINLKPVIADQLKIGSVIFIEVYTAEENNDEGSVK